MIFGELEEPTMITPGEGVPKRLREELGREGFIVMPKKDYDKILSRLSDLENELLQHGHREALTKSNW